MTKNEFETYFLILMPNINNSEKLKILNILGRKYKDCDIKNYG